MNRKISVGMAVSIVILAMTVTFSITMLVAMRLFDSTVSSVKEKESMYNKIAEVDRYVRSNDYYPIDETTLYDRLTAGYLLGTSTSESRIDLPVVCLVNGSTASAAELFASSLRTLNGARLVGTTTQGKGTIQSSPQRLSDGSAVVVTVAKLVCGDGSCFDGTGLTVDVERPLTADEQTAYYDYTVENDPQIQRAVSTAQQMSGTTTVSGVN